MDFIKQEKAILIKGLKILIGRTKKNLWMIKGDGTGRETEISAHLTSLQALESKIGGEYT